MSTLVKYYLGGSIAYGLELVITFIITELTGMWYMHAFLISLVFGLLFLFFFHKNITFKSKTKYAHKMFFYFILFAFIVNLGWYALSHFIRLFFEYHYLATLVVSSIPLSMFGYYINRKWIFKN